MCKAIFSGPKIPEVKTPPPAPTTQSNGDETGAQLANRDRRRKRGFDSTSINTLVGEAKNKTTLGG